MGPFEAFYASPLQHPVLLWAAALVGLAFALSRSGAEPGLRRYAAGLALLSLADAWLTASHVYGIGRLSGVAESAVPVFFVMAGDFRFLLLVASATPAGGLAPDARGTRAAVALTLVVPIGSQLLAWLLGAGPRVLFLVYELAFFLLTCALLRWHPRLRSAPWIVPVARFVLVYYGLWALADAILLATGSDLGFLLRVVPNLLYYGGFIGAIAWASARAGATPPPARA